ncbi:hypothetical protein G6011_04290 [Alternaria panax]|uniref:Uncharacterized protein n=1 Tax=Alternaria panax TaxID=48097 RepID=A0AAD4IGW3_9PLEO|nr:hypothetical protein G6011_04290 [Alternaria panax]
MTPAFIAAGPHAALAIDDESSLFIMCKAFPVAVESDDSQVRYCKACSRPSQVNQNSAMYAVRRATVLW